MAKTATKSKASEALKTIEKEGWELKNRGYKLIGKFSKTKFFILQSEDRPPNSRLLYWDEDIKQQRALRYAVNHPTPFVDEQEGNGEIAQEQIVFINGILATEKKEIALQKFLDKHPGNRKNGGKLFYEDNPAAEAKKEINMIKIEAEALSVALGLNMTKTEAVLRPQLGAEILEMKDEQITNNLLKYAKSNPVKFLEDIEDDNLDLKHLAYTAMDFHILKLTDQNSVLRYYESDKKLTGIPFGEDTYEYIAKWFKTDEGIEVMNTVTQQLKKK